MSTGHARLVAAIPVPSPWGGTRNVLRLVVLFAVVGAASCGQPPSTPPPRPAPAPPAVRPPAREIGGPTAVPGVTIDNFGVVVEGRIFRGSQPSVEQLDELSRLGVRTIVDLTTSTEPAVRAKARRLGISYVNIPVRRRSAPTDEAVAKFLAVATDASRLPMYVHCRGGNHRTGSFVAVFRVAVEGWSAAEAIAEMKAYGFYSVFGMHEGLKRYVVDYERRMKADPNSVPHAYSQMTYALERTRVRRERDGKVPMTNPHTAQPARSGENAS